MKKIDWRAAERGRTLKTFEDIEAARKRAGISPLLVINNQEEMTEWVQTVIDKYMESTDYMVREVVLTNAMQQETIDLACIALHQQFGFGEARLNRFIQEFAGAYKSARDVADFDIDSCVSTTKEEQLKAPCYWKMIDDALKEAMQGSFVEHEERYRWTSNPMALFYDKEREK